jgi:ankyrin repeat protein
MFPNPQDALPLPPHPNREQYKKLAKDLVRACQPGSAGAIRAWAERWIASLASLTNLSIGPGQPVRLDDWIEGVEDFVQRRLTPSLSPSGSLSGGSELRLANALFLIARSHGFESWARFAVHIELLMRENSMVSNFEAAADAVITGDVTTLERLLRENPDLARSRSTREHRATLLHYVSANGVEGYRQKTPKNAVKVAEILLEAGAEVDAEAEVYGGGATTLNLVATSVHPERAGVQEELMALLLSHGAALHSADVNACLANGRGRAAAFLAERGASLDLEGACGVGDLNVVKNFFREEGSLKPAATKIKMQRGFLWACEYGRNDVIDFLLQRRRIVEGVSGTNIDMEAQAGTGQTGLHWSVIGGQCETIKLLIAHGASLEAKNSYGGTALGQALWSAVNSDSKIDYIMVIETLLAAGAKLEDGSLAWLAQQKGGSSSVKQRIAAILRSHGGKS